MNTILYGLVVTLFGMGIVFLVLMALWGILAMMRPLFGRQKKQENNSAAMPINLTPAMTEAAAAAVEEIDADELVAVIAAAINACMGSHSNLVVRRITRVGDSTPVWGQLGRHEQTLNRL